MFKLAKYVRKMASFVKDCATQKGLCHTSRIWLQEKDTIVGTQLTQKLIS